MNTKNNYLLETKRLAFRKLTREDLPLLRPILGDEKTMYAWEYGFNDEQILGMINKHIEGYEKNGFSCSATILKSTDELIGIIGLLKENINDEDYIGLGYILGRKYWGNGYATESAEAWLDYAFTTLAVDEVIADIRPENTASIKVAKALGMRVVSEFTKNVNGKDMLHLIYSKKRE